MFFFAARRRVAVPRIVGSGLPAALLSGLLVASVSAQTLDPARYEPGGVVETFALADDRAQVLEQLIPGTLHYYYFQCLHAQHTGDLSRARQLIQDWDRQLGISSWLERAQARQLLLEARVDDPGAYQRLRDEFQLRFDHVRVVPDEPPTYPTRLDPVLISAATLGRQELSARPNRLDGFTDVGLEWAARQDLSPAHQRALLERLVLPDVPDLASRVVADLRAAHSAGFGSLRVHGELTLAQLEAVQAMMPELLQQDAFVRAVLIRLGPHREEDLERDLEARRLYLDRLLTFARRLGPAHNPVKVHAVYHRLALERRLGRYDRALFKEYLSLPRRVSYRLPQELERRWSQDRAAGQVAPPELALAPVRDDWPLVKDHLLHFLAEADSPAEFAPYLNSDLLKQLLVEAKITRGIGDPARWIALWDDPAAYERLERRVDLDFAPTQPLHYDADAPVSLELEVKNVPRLIVKIYPINALHVYRATAQEIDERLSLDGLEAPHEFVHEYRDPPWRRVRRRFDLPQLAQPGVYMVEFLGGGMASRAVIRKGRLRYTERLSAAGHVFQVYDDANERVPEARAWLAGREFRADTNGQISIPYTETPGRRVLVVGDGDGPDALATLTDFEHRAERYALTGGCHVEPETLIAGRRAPVLVRALLTVNDVPISLQLLEKPRLVIEATDHDDVKSRHEIAAPALSETREFVHEFLTPPRLQSLTISLHGTVQSLSTGKPVEVSLRQTIPVNGVDRAGWLAMPHLLREPDGWVLELRGKSGEPRAQVPLGIEFRHRLLVQPRTERLQTDAEGRIHLGPLPDIQSIALVAGPNAPRDGRVAWALDGERVRRPSVLGGRVGEILQVPLVGDVQRVTPEALALFELRATADGRNPVPVADHLDHLRIVHGMLELFDLTAGDYRLVLKHEERVVPITIVSGAAHGAQVVGPHWVIERTIARPLHIAGFEELQGEIQVRLVNATRTTRCHVLAQRYVSDGSFFDSHAPSFATPLTPRHAAGPLSTMLTGRALGDEFRYVLDRRQRPRQIGNLLPRPGLLLNPWARRETETVRTAGRAGWGFADDGSDERESGGVTFYGQERAGRTPARLTPNLDFLPDPALLLANLIPDADGIVRIPRARLAGHGLLRVVAVDDQQTVLRELVLGSVPFEPRDLTLRTGLAPEIPATEQQRITALAARAELPLASAESTAFEVYATLGSVYQLYLALTGEAKLAEFAFVVDWPSHGPEEQRALYSKHACHELHLFLARKDPQFFADVVLPHLASKLELTFLDRYLLDEDLTRYLDPWAHGRLNTLEKILLAGRLPGEPAATARHISDQVALLDVDRADWLRRFRTALSRRALETTGRLEHVESKRVVADADASKDAGFPAPAELAQRLRAGRPAASPAPGAPARAGEMLNDAAESTADQPHMQTGSDDDVPALRRADAERRKEVRRLYRKSPPTQELAENQYHHLHPSGQGPELIPPRRFWSDLAAHVAAGGSGPFLSAHFIEPTGSFTEMMGALAVLDLPFSAPEVVPQRLDESIAVRAESPVLVVHQEVQPSPIAEARGVIVAQRYLLGGQPATPNRGVRQDPWAALDPAALPVQTIIDCEVVVTQPTPEQLSIDLLLQIPNGALPVGGGFVTRSRPVQLAPYSTESFRYSFYFPRPGAFTHYPAQVARDGARIAVADGGRVTVLAGAPPADPNRWEVLSQQASTDEVLEYLQRTNLETLDLSLVAWRLREPAGYASFGQRLLSQLRQRHRYDPVLWSYGLLHRDPQATREWLAHADGFIETVGGWLEAPLLAIDPTVRGLHEHLEYDPYLPPRAHPFGATPSVPNEALAEQLGRFFALLCTRAELTSEDRLAAAAYLLVQGRIEEARAQLARVEPAAIRTRVQHDYLQAYLAFHSTDPEVARPIAVAQREHPVERWRTRFVEVLSQLDEARGAPRSVAPPGSEDPEGRPAVEDDTSALAATEPRFEMQLEAHTVTVTHQNLQTLRLNYYPMDAELLFSSQPFTRSSSADGGALDPWTSIRPLRSDVVALPPDGAPLVFALPDEFRSRNVIVEVLGGGKRQSRSHHASTLQVQFADSFGQLQVTHRVTGRPLPGSYVKVYARHAGDRTEFYKDGYTDLRGRFDYAALTVGDLPPAERFAVLVLHDEHGALIQEVRPPTM